METFKVVGNENYQIDSSRKITRVDGKPSNLKIKGKFVTIPLYNIIYKVEVEWLYWLSVFKLELPKDLRDKVTEYRFSDYKKYYNAVDEKIVHFNNPVYVDEEFRIIPRFPNYAVNKFGVIKNLKTNHLSYPKIIPYNIKNTYLQTSVNDQSNIRKSYLKTRHILVAQTWVKNPDIYNKIFVDHIDGNKTNCVASNLRWATPKENTNYAAGTAVNATAERVLVRNIDTGEITDHISITKACIFMGRSALNLEHTPLRADKIYKTKLGSYEIKKYDDKREWYYVDKKKILTGDTYTITITNEDGSKTDYSSNKEFREKEFNLSGDISLDNLIVKFKKTFPNRNISVVEHKKNLQGIEARNVVTNEVTRANSERLLAMELNMPKSTINKLCRSNGTRMYNDYVIRRASEDEWPRYSETEDRRLKIKIVDTHNDSIAIFNSITSAAKSLGTIRGRLTTCILRNSLYNNRYKITTINV